MTALPAYPGRFDTTQIANADEISARLKHAPGWLVDARAGERFRGEVEPLDPVAGHAGAVNRPFALNVLDGRLRDPRALRAELQGVIGNRDPQQVVLMCGSGVTACHLLLAMETAGLSGARIYADSWSGWVSDSSRRWRPAPEPRGVGSVFQRRTVLTPSTENRVRARCVATGSDPVSIEGSRRTVEGGVGPVAGREPHGCGDRATWVRALCLRSTASQAPERPAASGWAGPRGTCSGPATGATRHPSECQLLTLTLLLRVQGAATYLTGCSGTFASTRAQGNSGPGSRLRATVSAASSLAGTCSRSSWSCPAIRCSDG